MKKIVFLFLILIGAGIFSCDLKNRLLHNTITIAIEPAVIEFILFNSSQPFRAIVRNARGEFLDVDVNWSISGFSNDVKISNNVGKSVVFETGTGNGNSTGILMAEYRGVRQSVKIEVTNDLILYRNGQWGSIIDRRALNNCLYLPEYISMCEREDDGTCLEFTVKQPPTGQLPTFSLKFQPSQDLSSYSSLQFSAKCANTEVIFSTFTLYMIQNVGDSSPQQHFNLTAQSGWEELSANLEVTRNNVELPLSISFQNIYIPAGQPRTLRINNIRFVK